MEYRSAREVDEVLGAYLPAAALAAALELGVFWHLVDGPMSPSRLAAALDIAEERCGPWLDHLVLMGFLVRRQDGVGLSEAARIAIVGSRTAETWRLLAQEAREDYPIGLDLATRLRSPVDAPPRELPTDLTDYVEEMRRDPERARRFTRMLFELHQDLARDVAETLDLTGVRRLLDLGGGSGVVSLALLRANPGLRVTVADLAGVCAAGREIADEAPEGDRLTHHPVDDYLRDPLPDGFDAVLQCDVDVLTPPLFAQVVSALAGRGRFFSVERGSSDDHRGRVVDRFRASLRGEAGAYPTFDEIRDGLAAAGLEIVGVRDLPRTGWQVLEARAGA
jgi:predicted TPR repeat methyltransferase